MCNNKLPSRAKPPLARQVLAMASSALEEGDHSMATGLLVAFNSFLLPCKLRLSSGHCTLDLSLEDVQIYPSTSSVTISRQFTCWHRCWPAAPRAGPPPFSLAKRLASEQASEAVRQNRADPQRYKTYSLRRGGTSKPALYIQDEVAMLGLIAKERALLRRLASPVASPSLAANSGKAWFWVLRHQPAAHVLQAHQPVAVNFPWVSVIWSS